MAVAAHERSPIRTVEMGAPENVARALDAMWVDELDDDAALAIARSELHKVSDEISQLAGIPEPSPDDVDAAAQRLAGIGAALRQLESEASA